MELEGVDARSRAMRFISDGGASTNTPTASTGARARPLERPRCRTAPLRVTCRRAGAKMNPIRSAPAAAAAAACSGSRKPSILTIRRERRVGTIVRYWGLSRPRQQRLDCRDSVGRGNQPLPHEHRGAPAS